MTNKEQFDLIEKLYWDNNIQYEAYEDLQFDLYKNWPCDDLEDFYELRFSKYE